MSTKSSIYLMYFIKNKYKFNVYYVQNNHDCN